MIDFSFSTSFFLSFVGPFMANLTTMASQFLLILFGSAIINNYVLVYFLGLCPFMGVSKQLNSAIGIAFATTFVMTLSSGLTFLCYHYILMPYNLTYLKTVAFILSIALAVQVTEIYLQQTSPVLHRLLGLFLPLITSNCAVLGVALLNVKNQVNSLFWALSQGFGAAIGFSLVLILFAALREKLAIHPVPNIFKGHPIAFITAGLMALAFSGFTGLGQ